tara:strand:+ start:509 stop:850 length:342 start_codon:yes stop_codon:yes gene_type:complete
MIKYLLILYILSFSYSLLAFDENDLIRLKKTGNCLNCNLKNADLGGMNLRGADLEGSSLKGSILIGTDLSYSNLKGVNLTSTFIRSTNFCNSIMPEGNISIDGCSNSEIPKLK